MQSKLTNFFHTEQLCVHEKCFVIFAAWVFTMQWNEWMVVYRMLYMHYSHLCLTSLIQLQSVA